jgi:hypothetical protein
MREPQRFADLPSNAEGFGDGQLAMLMEMRLEIDSLDELADKEAPASIDPEIEQGDEMRVGEPPQSLHFREKLAPKLRLVS